MPTYYSREYADWRQAVEALDEAEKARDKIMPDALKHLALWISGALVFLTLSSLALHDAMLWSSADTFYRFVPFWLISNLAVCLRAAKPLCQHARSINAVCKSVAATRARCTNAKHAYDAYQDLMEAQRNRPRPQLRLIRTACA